MTKIDFYILKSGSCEQVACKLVEKAFSLGHRIYVHTSSEDQAKRIDHLLWTFKAGSFLPHQCYQPDSGRDAPIQIGTHEAPDIDSDVLINLAPEVPLFFSRFQRVAELVGPDEQEKSQGREHFQFYRDRGYFLDTHELRN
jgi:DNA polymerase-3 subunit chi